MISPITVKNKLIIMAEILENGVVKTAQEIPSNGKANAGLTLGIIGTALGALGVVGGGTALFGGGNKRQGQSCVSDADLYLEREMVKNYVSGLNDYYTGQLSNVTALKDAFFDSYKRDMENSFIQYKYTRDSNDELSHRIDAVDKKVDVMAAIRPYQDALIDAKIDKNAILADYNLSRRTCRMIQGVVVLPDSSISGFEGASDIVHSY